MYVYVNVVRVRSPTAVSSPAAVKKSQILTYGFNGSGPFHFHMQILNLQGNKFPSPPLPISTQQR